MKYTVIVPPFRTGLPMLDELAGPVIRITPREVHISDPYYINDIYVNPKRRDRDPAAQANFNATTSIGSTVEHDLHKKRRDAMSSFFSKKSIGEVEYVVAEKVDELCGIISRSRESGLPFNLSDAFFALTRE